MAAWPTTGSFPQKLLKMNGFALDLPDNTIRTSMEVGPPKVRRRSTAAPTPVNGKQLLTSSQVDTLETFYRTTLSDGALPFDWVHPKTQTACVMRFKKPPRWYPAGGTYYWAEYQLEILP